ncbi:MAG: hypothetical protein ABJB12_01920 [Pseudomonadota bacterium]
MSEEDRPQRGTVIGEADSTLMGVAPPRIDSSADSPQRSPVLVRAGTSSVDSEPELVSRAAVPRRPPSASAAAQPSPAQPPHSGLRGTLETARDYVGARPVIGMVLFPVLCALSLIALARHPNVHRGSVETARAVNLAPSAATGVPAASTVAAPPSADTIAELERRPPNSLHARELVALAEAHDQRKRAAASALREKLARDPALAKDPGTGTQLLALCADPATAPDALLAMTELGPAGADLLYEAWTSTVVRTDTTELARALLYSPEVRPQASPALGVALDLRVAESCQQYQAVLPDALKDGDRRALHLLAKLTSKRGCGPKKREDCYACLRGKTDELSATINAAKSRRPPSFVSAQ